MHERPTDLTSGRRSRTALFAIAGVVAAGLAAVTAAPATAATQASFYVSPSGSDSNAGTLNAPFQTVQKAQSAVRAVNGAMTGDIHVYLRGGSYPVTSTLTFGPSDSGSNGYRVVWSNYASEKPVLEGGTAVTGWTQQSGNIWRAPLARSTKLRSLYVNGVRATMASKTVQSAGCYGSYSITAGQAPWAWDSGTECDGSQYALGDVPAVTTNVSDMEVMTSTTWTTQIVGVRQDTTSSDGQHRVLLFQQPGAAIAMHAYNGNFQTGGTQVLMNAYQFLDSPGEFFFDRSAGVVYYDKRASDTMSSATVYAPNGLTTLLSLQGSSTSSRVHDLTFSGLTVQHSDWNLANVAGSSFKQAQQGNLVNLDYAGANFHQYYYRNVDVEPAAVEMRNATRIAFTGNTVRQTGADGVDLVNDVSSTQLTGNITDDVGGSAITVGHPQNVYIGDGTSTNGERYGAGVEGAPVNVTVTDNLLDDSAVLFNGSAGVSVYFADGLVLDHNLVRTTPWAGISLGWGWGEFDGTSGSVAPGNPTTTARNNSVQDNQLVDTMQVLYDSSPLYTLGSQPGSTVSGNFVDGVPAGNRNGLHTDEGSANIAYTGNVLQVDQGAGEAISTGTWGRQNNLTFTDNYGVNNKIFDKNVPGSTVDNLIVSPDAVWPAPADQIAVGSGLEPAYAGLLKSFTTATGTGASDPDWVLPASTWVPNGSSASVPVRSTGSSSNTLWLAPAGTTSFTAGPTMTSAPGTATAMAVPTTPGAYRLFVVGGSGSVSAASPSAVWRVGPAPTGATIIGVPSGRCIDVPNGSQDNGTTIALWDCSGVTNPLAANQQWTYTAAKELRVYGGTKCLDAFGNGQGNGTAVGIWDCNGAANQQWDLHPNGTITGVGASLCLDADNGGTADGTKVFLWGCNNGPNQAWQFTSH